MFILTVRETMAVMSRYGIATVPVSRHGKSPAAKSEAAPVYVLTCIRRVKETMGATYRCGIATERDNKPGPHDEEQILIGQSEVIKWRSPL
jgi:hypothetical protein